MTKPRRGRKTPPRALGATQRAPTAAEGPVLAALALLALTFYVYRSVTAFHFVDFDDPTYVTANPHVQAGLSWQNVLWAFTTNVAPSWHPLTWLSHMVDVDLFGLDAGMHHVTSAVIHAANSLLLFAWLRRVTAAHWKSVFVAAVFAVHPLHVESVAWVAERKDVLATFFWLLTLWAYAWYAARPTAWRYCCVSGAFAAGLMSKPSVVTLPLILLLVDVWPLRRVSFTRDRPRWTRLVAEKAPWFVLALIASAVTVVFQSRAGAVSSLTTVPLGSRLVNGVLGYAVYLYKMIWPAHLAAFYPVRDWPAIAAVAALVAMVCVTLASLRVRQARPYVLVGWLWYLITLLPMIGLVQVGSQAVADRYMYVPMIGLLMVIAWGVPELAAGWPPARQRVVPLLAGAAVIALALTARPLVDSWSDRVALWRHAILNSTDNYLAYVNLGSALVDQGDAEGGLAAYRSGLNALRGRWPGYQAAIHCNIGLALLRRRDPARALAAFSEATRLDPTLVEARVGEATSLDGLGRFPEAVDRFQAALRIAPQSVQALRGVADGFVEEGRSADAIPFYEKALALAPSVAEVHNALGSALATTGHQDAALSEFEAAARLRPDFAPAFFNLGQLLADEGKMPEARRNLEHALAVDPANEQARQLLLSLPKSQ